MAYGRNIVYDARDPAPTNGYIRWFKLLYSVIRTRFSFYEFKFLIFSGTRLSISVRAVKKTKNLSLQGYKTL